METNSNLVIAKDVGVLHGLFEHYVNYLPSRNKNVDFLGGIFLLNLPHQDSPINNPSYDQLSHWMHNASALRIPYAHENDPDQPPVYPVDLINYNSRQVWANPVKFGHQNPMLIIRGNLEIHFSTDVEGIDILVQQISETLCQWGKLVT